MEKKAETVVGRGIKMGFLFLQEKNKFHFERVIRMKKIMFGNSLMLFGIALLILAGLEIMPIYVFWPAVILVLAGFIMAVIGYFSKGNKEKQ